MAERVAYVFVHGLSGTGEYDKEYAKKPYWGRSSGDIVAELRGRGLNAHAASVSAQGSAWDRACELYAQIEGTRCDYGLAHSREFGHSRVGRDFFGQELFPNIDSNTKLVFIAHSFGGVTVRLFAELLANGSEIERDASRSMGVSGLFCGERADRVAAIVTLAAPTNGTTAYNSDKGSDDEKKHLKLSPRYHLLHKMLQTATKVKRDGRDERDWADYDMQVDHAIALNKSVETLSHVYYLSVAADATEVGPDGTRVPIRTICDPLMVKNCALMGAYEGVSPAGVKFNDAWQANDGLVNTLSARAPFGAVARDLKGSDPEPGVWNVMDDLHVDHSYFQGGFTRKVNPRSFYDDLIERLTALPL